MPIKISGADFKRFYNDPAIWGGEKSDTYLDDDHVTINGKEFPEDADIIDIIKDDDVLVVSSGYLANPQSGVPEDYVAAIRWWLRRQKLRTMVVEYEESKREQVLAALKAAGAKVLN
jgi:hypothetical protein